MKFAIIGCGLIGGKRVAALPAGSLAAACDIHLERAESLASRCEGAIACSDYLEAIRHPEVSGVIVSTLNGTLTEIARAAVENGKHVIVEKPAGINVEAVEALHQLAEARGVKVRVGFNHRYHPALLKARDLFESGVLGPMLFVRARYGHGGRVGYDREWRADPALSGGGELIDQGVHLIDLAGWFLGDFSVVEGHASTLYWDMPVDDNAFLSLRTAAGQTAWLHASCTEWKNLFSFEIYGRNAKLHIEGLGGSYGIEKITLYKMLPAMGPPETTCWEYPRGDVSWAVEMQEFVRDIAENRIPNPGLPEALKALHIIRTISQNSQKPSP